MPEPLTGVRNSAIVLLSLGQEQAAEVLRRMPEEMASILRDEMQRVGGLRDVSLPSRQLVLGQFCAAASTTLLLPDSSTEPYITEDDARPFGSPDHAGIQNPRTRIGEGYPPATAQRGFTDSFENLLAASDTDVQAVIEQLDLATISMALRTAPKALKQKMMANLSARQLADVQEELKTMNAVLVSDIEAAQQRIAEVVHRLESAGEIELARRPDRRKRVAFIARKMQRKAV